MASGKIEKITGLVIAAGILTMSIAAYFVEGVGESLVGRFALSPDAATFPARLLYSFIHVSPIHALLNAWCLLSIVFLAKVEWEDILTAYIVALSVFTGLLSGPTVGLSGVCFALLGILAVRCRRPWWFCLQISPYIAIGFLLPAVAGALHLYCFLAGILFEVIRRVERWVRR